MFKRGVTRHCHTHVYPQVQQGNRILLPRCALASPPSRPIPFAANALLFYFLRFPPKFKIAPSLGESGLPSNTWYRAYPSHIPNGISIGSAVFVWVPNDTLYNMHCQWGRKPPKPPLLLGISSPCRRGPSHGNKEHAQKNW